MALCILGGEGVDKGQQQVTAQFRFPRFFVTTPSPCPYLPGKTERKVFTELSGPHAAELNDALGRIGFRRSQNVAYRPSCADCSACVSVRVVANQFEANASQRKLLRRHSDLVVNACKPWTTQEQFSLLRRYLATRHPGGGMAEMDEIDFADMVEQTPVSTFMIEYREPSVDGRPGRLVGACLTDQQGDGLSMVYSFFEPDEPKRPGLGTFIAVIGDSRFVLARDVHHHRSYRARGKGRASLCLSGILGEGLAPHAVQGSLPADRAAGSERMANLSAGRSRSAAIRSAARWREEAARFRIGMLF